MTAIWKKFLAYFVVAALIVPMTAVPSYADFAKNVIAEGRFNYSLIHQTVYYYQGTYSYPPVYVIDINTFNQTAFVQFPNYSQRWVNANSLYTAAQKDIALAAEYGGTAAVLCLFFCPRGNSGGSGGGGGNDYAQRERAREECIRGCGYGIDMQSNYIAEQCKQNCQNRY